MEPRILGKGQKMTLVQWVRAQLWKNLYDFYRFQILKGNEELLQDSAIRHNSWKKSELAAKVQEIKNI